MPRRQNAIPDHRTWTGTPVRGLLHAARYAVLTCLIGMLAVSAAPALAGWTCAIVVSGSMAPGVRAGDVIIAAPAGPGAVERPGPGTIVLVDDPARPGDLLLHRVTRYDIEGRMVLKGDANRIEDGAPAPLAALRGTPSLRVPAIGLPVVWVRQGRFLPVLAVAGLLTALVAGKPPSRMNAGDHLRCEGRRAIVVAVIAGLLAAGGIVVRSSSASLTAPRAFTGAARHI